MLGMAGHACNPNSWEVEAGRGKFKPAWAHRARPCLTGSSQWWWWMDGSKSRAVDWMDIRRPVLLLFCLGKSLSYSEASIEVERAGCVFHPQTFSAQRIADREWIVAGWQVVLGSFCPSVLETFCPSEAFVFVAQDCLIIPCEAQAPDVTQRLGLVNRSPDPFRGGVGGVTLMVSYHLGYTSVLKAERSFWDF